MSSDRHPWLSSCLATRVGRVKPRPLQALTAHYAKHWWQLLAGEHSVDLDGKKCMDLNEDELTLRTVGGQEFVIWPDAIGVIVYYILHQAV